MGHAARAAALVAATLALAPGCSQTSGEAPEPVPSGPRIRLATSPSGQRTIDVAGLVAADLVHLERTALSRDVWQAILRVHVAQADPASAELPPVLGDYAVHAGALRFTPRFPFYAGQRYEVVFDPSPLPSARGRPHPSRRAPSARWSRCRLLTASRRPASSPSIRQVPRCRRTTFACTSSSPHRWAWAAAVRTCGCSTRTAARLPTRFCRWTSTCGTRIACATRFSTTRGASSAASGRTPSWAARCRWAAGTHS